MVRSKILTGWPTEKEFNLSISLYTEAISLNPKDATIWNNRAMSKAKMEEHGGAISDASESSNLYWSVRERWRFFGERKGSA